MANKATLSILSLISLASAHYTFPWLNVNGVNNTYWANTRITNNYNSLNPVTDVNSSDIRCYDSAPPSVTAPVPFTIAAGTPISIGADPGGVCCGSYHQSISQVYMAQVPSGENAATWEPTDAVWFKVAEVPPITNGGTSITWAAMGAQYVNFTIPSELPSGTYLVRTENVALQSASVVSGAQFYLSCTLLEVTGGGSGTPGPLVAFPGAYTGYEPGLLLNIFYPIPATYTMPGPAIWPPGGGATTSSASKSTTTTSGTKTTTTTTTKTTSKTTTTTTSASGAAQTAYGQCGGSGWTGATACVSGYVCEVINSYYSQCVPS